jgi:hypothetical protein
MFTLIIREIEDNWVFFLSVIILAVILSSIVVYQQFYDADKEVYKIIVACGTAISILLVIVFCAMGAAQMYWDKTKKVSALLATLAVTRKHIFIARIIAGFLLVLIGFVPIAETIITAISKTFVAFPSVHSGLYFEILIPAFLLGFACYCIGLQTGWTSNRTTAILGALGLSVILIPVILIKGFGWEIYAILFFLTAACLIRAWYKFSTAAL